MKMILKKKADLQLSSRKAVAVWDNVCSEKKKSVEKKNTFRARVRVCVCVWVYEACYFL